MANPIIDRDLFRQILDKVADELAPEQKERVMKYFPRAYESGFLGIVVDTERTLFMLNAYSEVTDVDHRHIDLWFLYQVFGTQLPWDWIEGHCCDEQCYNLGKTHFGDATNVDVCGLIHDAEIVEEDVFFDD